MLNLVFDKFGVQLSESLFWSEAFKKIKHLPTPTPLLLKEDKEIFEKIAEYFEKSSAEFLRENLD